MAGKTLTHLSEFATQETNTTGVLDPILTYDPEQGTIVVLENRVAKGDEAGIPMFADLRDNGGSPLPEDTELMFRVKRPTDEEPMTVSTKVGNISAWNSLTTTQQRNEENIDAIKIDLKGPEVRVRYVDEFRVEVNSSVQIDWSNSTLEFYRKALRFESFTG